MIIDDFNFNLDNKTFIICELSANHSHDINIALKSIEIAKEIGANAVKIQTYTPDTMTIDCDKEDFVIKGTIWDGSNLYKLYQQAYTPWEWHKKLFKKAKEIGITLFSSPFDSSSVDFLEQFDVPAYKIASFEITDIPLIKYIASKGKPIILSTGIATLEDIILAIDTIKNEGNDQIILLKCTSSYPAPYDEMNLSMIKKFSDRFGVISGLSDHTIGSTVPLLSLAFGARVIEKHFIIDRSIGGPDSSFSMDKDEFSNMIKEIRKAEKSIGSENFLLTDSQIKGRDFSRSLYVVDSVKKGQIVSEKNVRSIRPGFGLHPKHLPEVLGKKFNLDVEKGTRFSLDLID